MEKHPKSAFARIVDWNMERGLIKTPGDVNLLNEMSFITEELIEMGTLLESEDARKIAKAHAELMYEKTVEHTPEQVVDAAGDIIVFATGLIRKMGYDVDKTMEEVLREIESRRGTIIEGKFVKDKSQAAQALWYKANFSNAKL